MFNKLKQGESLTNMSYPLQPYQPLNRPVLRQDQGVADLLGPIFGLANQIMSELLHGAPSDPRNPHLQVFGISSMNVTQISRGLDGRPHIVQALDERRLGPGGVWQTKKAMRDPQRGIDKMKIGYFMGDRSEVIEHEFASPTSDRNSVLPQTRTNRPPPQRQQALPAPPPYRYR